MSKSQELRTKVAILGDEAVGKTALIKRHVNGESEFSHPATVWVDFTAETLRLDDGVAVHVQLWDIAGAPRFWTLAPSYADAASVVVLVFDVTRRATFENIQRWLDMVAAGLDENAMVILVGNKTDLGDSRQVSREEGEASAQQLGAAYLETSAAAGAGVDELFRQAAKSAVKPTSQAQLADPQRRLRMAGRASWEDVPLDDWAEVGQRNGLTKAFNIDVSGTAPQPLLAKDEGDYCQDAVSLKWVCNLAADVCTGRIFKRADLWTCGHHSRASVCS